MTADTSNNQKNYYESHDRLFVSVDCIVFGLNGNELQLLLIKRDFEPHKGQLSLMGGFVKADESVDDAARRVLKDLTGLEGVYMNQVGTFGEVERDPGQRVVSVAYSALLNFPDIDHETVRAHNAHWVSIDEIPKLCFDHNKMIEKAIVKLGQKFRVEPLVFNLLPDRFTLTQLQQLYEVMLGTKIDKRNFRRRALENSCIVPTDMVDKHNSRRGARLYVYSPEESKNEHFKI